MNKITKEKREGLKIAVDNVELPMEERKAAHKEVWGSIMNPKRDKDFDPETFDSNEGVPSFDVKKRVRVTPPRRLPTMGMKPKELFQGQMIGMYESKQDLYLLIAWLSERISDLEDTKKVA